AKLFKDSPKRFIMNWNKLNFMASITSLLLENFPTEFFFLIFTVGEEGIQDWSGSVGSVGQWNCV
ncbi:3688_t:CDS:2, partial [Ambispora gerdemannii]